MNDLRSDLSTLLESSGWKVFSAYVESEWGAGGTRFESFLNTFADSRQEDPMVLQQIRQIAVARREILRLMKWPTEELAKLRERAKDHEPQMSRRGGL